MIRYYSTASIPLSSPSQVGDLLFWFDGDDATSTTWVDKLGAYSLDTTSVTITDGYAVFTGSERLPIGTLPNLDQWAIISLVRPTSTSSIANIMSNDAPDYNDDVLFGITKPPQYGMTYHSDDDASVTDIFSPAVAPQSWATVALVVDNKTAKIYVNGVISASITKTFNFTYGNSLTTSYMGGSGQVGRNWVGNIKQLMMYQESINESDIEMLHNYLITKVT